MGLGAVFGLVFGAVGPWVLPRLFDTAPDLVADLRVAIIVYAVQVVVDQASNGCQASLDGLQRADLSRLSDGVRRTLVAVAVAVVAALGGDSPRWPSRASGHQRSASSSSPSCCTGPVAPGGAIAPASST